MKRDPRVRYPITEGLFYPAEEEELKRKVDSLLLGDREASPALIVPHASFDLVGEACGRAWQKCAKRPITKILLISPIHGEAENYAALPPFHRFATPLGEIEADKKILEKLKDSSPLFREDIMPWEEEHAPELSLPFAGRLFPDIRIIPILTGNHRRKDIKEMGRVLGEVLRPYKDDLLTVISTNLSRFITPEVSQKEADNFVSIIEGKALSEQQNREISACGRNGLELFREMGLYEGNFEEICRFEKEERENRKSASLHYGSYRFVPARS
ncbi:MAG: AmmeMemoRadiSam system protein B [Spirochaetales bacterium]|nr:AmmeMemoRadiSam system protein B [Spirochaetales bacterium]